jgi:hypothetical protein
MTLKAGIATSSHPNPLRAAEEVVARAKAEGGIVRPDFVILYATVAYPQEALVQAVFAAAGGAPLIGCSAEGIISQHGSSEDTFAVMVTLIESDTLRFQIAAAAGLAADSTGVGRTVGSTLRSGLADDNLAMLVFADGLTLNFDRFALGLGESLQSPRFLPLLGGTAGDSWEFKQTYQYVNGSVLSDSAVCALVSGPMRLAYGVNHGCLPVGKKRTITKADGPVIFEIDHKPALAVMREYVDIDEENDWPKAIQNLALGFEAPREISKQYDEYVIRYIPAKDDDAGSIRIPTEVKAGDGVWMTRRDHEKILSGVDRLAADLRKQIGEEKTQLVLQFDCAGRGKVIFKQDQLQALQKRLRDGISPTVAWSGFHCYSEIGPVNQSNLFHNFTAVVAVLY